MGAHRAVAAENEKFSVWTRKDEDWPDPRTGGCSENSRSWGRGTLGGALHAPVSAMIGSIGFKSEKVSGTHLVE
jgi:hypothetical protein